MTPTVPALSVIIDTTTRGTGNASSMTLDSDFRIYYRQARL